MTRVSSDRSWRVHALTVAAVFGFCALAMPPFAKAAQPVMTRAAGSDPLTLTSSSALPDGRYDTHWAGNGTTLEVRAPAGSQVAVHDTTVEVRTLSGAKAAVHGKLASVTPPQALAGSAAAASLASHGRRGKGQRPVRAHAAAGNPPDHSWYNPLQLYFCNGGVCLYASSDQYAIQEIPGAWYMGQYTTGTEYPAGVLSSYGEAYNRFPGESGDSGPLNYKPNGFTSVNGGTSNWSWSFSFGGFGFSESGSLGQYSQYGPVFPTCSGCPAFGSIWLGSNYYSANGLGSGDAIHLGPGQSPYDDLVGVVTPA